MTRHCRVGDRARIVNGGDQGKIVLVLRKYHGERIDGAIWVERLLPWVVVSLSGRLGCINSRTKAELPSVMTAVYDDSDLEPLRDDDPDITEVTDMELPRRSEVVTDPFDGKLKIPERAT